MKKILESLFDHRSLDYDQAKDVLVRIASGEFNASQLSAMLSVYLMRNIKVEELTGFRDAMLELAVPVTLDFPDTIDIVGTGGDNKNTFNISTLSCFVTAGAGYHVSKHGNYGVSSISGSSNVLERLGYKFSADQSKLNAELDKAKVCFMHAPLFHPAMKTVAPVRKELGVRTFFNILGPLVNPAKPANVLLGTYNVELARLYHYTLQTYGRAYTIVHSYDGYDEISLTSDFKMFTEKTETLGTPEYFGFGKIDQTELYGGESIPEAAEIFISILENRMTGDGRNAVIANAALAIQTMNRAINITQAVQLAKESLDSGAALESFNTLISMQK